MGLLLIAKDNIKKRKGNAFILFLLVALAVLLLYTGISVLFNMGKVIDNRNDATHGADYALFTLSADTDTIKNLLEQQKEMEYLESEKAIYASAVKFYADNSTEENADQLEFIFLNKDTDRKLSVIQLIDKGNKWKDNSIILPYYMKVGMGYRTGDILKLVYNHHTYSFEIYGFTEDVMFSTPTNISAEKCFISARYFEKYSSEWGNVGTLYHANLKDSSNIEKFEGKMNQMLNKQIADFKYLNNWSFNYDTMKYGTSITANIFMGVLTAFAVLLIFISLVIVHFNISNYIEMNIRNIGMLEASGYTSRQMLGSTVLEFLILSVFGSCAGLLGAVFASEFIGGIVSASIGLCWKMGFDGKSALLSIGIMLLMMLSAVILCSGKFRKIAPLDALRNGIHTHNFQKNHIRLDQVKLPLNLAVGIKSILYNRRKNIMICLIIVLLSFCANEAVCIYQNFAVQEDKLLEITGFEVPDITVAVSGKEGNELSDAMSDIRSKIEKIDGIDQILEYTAFDLICKYDGKEVTVNCDIYDNTDNLRINNVVEGRRPEYSNEVMLSTAMADKLGVSIGDVVYLEMNGTSQDYLLVGISQGITHLGKKGMVTLDGIQRLDADIRPACFNIYVRDQKKLGYIVNHLQKKLTDETVTVTNFQDYVSASMKSIVTVMKVMCAVMMITVILVIAMILILLIKIQLIRDQKQLGIYKALGYTTRQLILQTVMSYIPVVLLGAFLGCILAWFGVNPSFVLCLTAFGIKQCSMHISMVYMFAVVAGIVLWAALISVLCSVRIRKIVPWKMMQEL